ncbi:AlpA family transcriptional regulator [Variovorax sp. NFACC27]|mgnify:CR=1 FL=1|uniref:helix-turn-helix transcriptional regulator n=1 Tax=unclassified Variovorax TaxID=663243 RepID=UPI0008999DFD|nr:transcriptional regulator, AlpA family [Variovorax sp. NFACC28]SEG85993.1 transcriptional regulator, AlpA family [Variovorax sp. NFACC29]SFD22572.1 transcriptional regulator, AlpA family [Variovorax sp. NFACC26]SFG29391.1 transcriptional regulator, AlpA family [Variovorax sp. NFACC27]
MNTRTAQTMNEKLLVPAAEAARLLSMGRSTFWNKVRLKQLPQPVKIAGITRWRVADLRSFVDLPRV